MDKLVLALLCLHLYGGKTSREFNQGPMKEGEVSLEAAKTSVFSKGRPFL